MGRTSTAKSATVVVGGLLLGWGIFWLAGNWPALRNKLRGNAPDCPWTNTLRAYRDNKAFYVGLHTVGAGLHVEQHDPTLQLELIRSPERAFWIKEGKHEQRDGQSLLAYLLAEHGLLGETNPDQMVRPGDTVIDCGAHIGVFTHFALKRGASKVVAVEPDPTNLECFRRNFAAELVSGRVALVEKGVWNAPGRLVLRESTGNSGSNSLVGEEHGQAIEIEVTTIDLLVSELRLPRVDYVKMDIEGAEREALRGARETLRKFGPRLMLDAYHRPDDMTVLPGLVRRAHSGYVDWCGPCELDGDRLVPHAVFFQP
ncbi:MAG: FkbM family methyltransferase [Bryobacteraceae bacterium]